MDQFRRFVAATGYRTDAYHLPTEAQWEYAARAYCQYMCCHAIRSSMPLEHELAEAVGKIAVG